MIYEIVDTISHRDNPFDKIQWYAILSSGDKYFFNTFETTEYPVHSARMERGDVVPLQGFHVDIVVEVYYISGSKMDKKHYNRLMSIKKQIVRDSKIDELLNE